jgi:NAD-dependent protein deacetylase/lipoamidase
MTSDDPAETEEPPAWARGVRTVAVLTGAGISTDSGIPDFRGPQGVWTRNPAAEKMSTFQAYVADPEVRRRSWQARRAHPVWRAEPNAAHLALTDLAASTVETWVITQNIDGLHQKAGLPADRVVELHGTLFGAVCVGCGDRTAMDDVLARVAAGDDDPACKRCGGILKSATVMFGEMLDHAVFERAVRITGGCDLFIAVGSTLIVEPAASLCGIAVDVGAGLVVINRDPTPYDRLARAVIRAPISTALPRVVRQIIRANRGTPR